MTTPLRIGVIGAGAIATLGHIPGFSKLPNVQVVAICDTNRQRAQEAATKFNVPQVYEDYQELVSNNDIDAVSVGLPNALHAPVTIAALEAGKHVLCEKPLATTVEDGRAMVAAAEKAGKVLGVNMHMRLSASSQIVRDAITTGKLGKVGYTNARWFRSRGIPGFGSWFTRRELAGGGVLMDIGVHMLDLALWINGLPKVMAVRGEIQAIHGPRGRGLGGWGMDRVEGGIFDVEDFAAIHLRLADGGLVTVEVSWAIHGRDEMRIIAFGDEGGADVAGDLYGNDKPLRFYRDEGEVIAALPKFSNSEWDRSMARFVAAINGSGEPTATGGEALRVLELLNAAYRSATEGREIEV